VGEEKKFLEEQEENFTDVKEQHFQRCHQCNKPLLVVKDHYGGGSHYWTLVCGECMIRFVYDTYEFKLCTWPKEGRGETVARWGQRNNHE
jgi:ssDNA-binding Zn-finger/Zn-ribbon topoisomerase 1